MEQQTQLAPELENEEKSLIRDRNRLLQFLPAEIWQHVITRSKQEDISDNLENLLNSSPFYRNLFDSQKTKFLFEKVFIELLGQDYLPELKDALRCRQVCKVWNHEIDKFLTHRGICPSYSKRTNEFESYDKLVKFLTHFEHTHPKNDRNPFISTELTLTVNEHIGPDFIEDNEPKFILISRMLEKYGNHIQHLSVIFGRTSNQTLKNWLAKMKEWLLNTENLVSLRLINRMPYLSRDQAENGQPFLIESYPNLRKLEELYINKCIPEDVGLDLIRNNKHIRKLTVVKNGQSNINHVYNILNFPDLPNLKLLDIIISSIGKITNLRNINFPHLTTLTLTGKGEFNVYQQTRWSKIFSIIQDKFSNTLKRLSLEMEGHDSQVLSDTRTFRLNLPKLKELRLLVNGTKVSLDFMLPMKESLEQICVIVTQSMNVEGTLIRLLDFDEIWVNQAGKLFDFVHFDKPFMEIIDWVVDVTHETYEDLLNDKLILRC